MTVVSTQDFVANHNRYFDLAENEQVFIKRGKNLFIVTRADEDDSDELELAKERKNSGGEFTSTSDFINYLRK